LWPEIQTGDRCLDRECFRKKSAAQAHQQLVKLEKAAKTSGSGGPLRLSCAWHTGTEGVLAKPKWAPEEGNSCDHLRQGVVVEDGTAHPAGVGNTLLVCTERACKVHWGGLYQPPAPARKKTPLESALEQRELVTLRMERKAEQVLEDRKIDLAVQLQTWPMDLAVLRKLVLGFKEWLLEKAAKRRGFELPVEPGFTDAVSLMDGKELAGLLFELVVDDSPEGDEIIAAVLSSQNVASGEERVEAVQEEVLAEFRTELDEANKKVEQLQADAGNPATRTAKGKGRKK
jgi:hypothetical protein